MTPDRRNAVKHGWFTTWQWAVLGAYFIAIVLSVWVGNLASRADDNARRGNAAICVEVAFLRNSLDATERLIQTSPRTPESRARAASAQRLRELIRHLEVEVPDCRTALK